MNSVFSILSGVNPRFDKSFKQYIFKLKKQFTINNSQFTKKVFAFTLAETLIVMGVIGVVAALTIPSLNNSTNDKEKVAKVKKAYSVLNDAYGRAVAMYGPYEDWDIGGGSEADFKKVGKRLTQFMKLIKNCEMDETKGCKTDGAYPHKYNGQEAPGGEDGYMCILSDGTSIEIFGFKQPYVFVDIDGPNKGPYAHGKDVFYFDTSDALGLGKGFFPGATSEGKNEDPTKCPASVVSGYGDECTAWVVEFGNMDYRKINSSKKCPNGNVLDGITNKSCD